MALRGREGLKNSNIHICLRSQISSSNDYKCFVNPIETSTGRMCAISSPNPFVADARYTSDEKINVSFIFSELNDTKPSKKGTFYPKTLCLDDGSL